MVSYTILAGLSDNSVLTPTSHVELGLVLHRFAIVVEFRLSALIEYRSFQLDMALVKCFTLAQGACN